MVAFAPGIVLVNLVLGGNGMLQQGIIDWTGTETYMFVMDKKLKRLFASTLNVIAVSVRCVSSMIVVINAKLPD